ncbi:monooxygenase [Pseudomonas sp. M47T1]|uniref:FAD-dependent monooxygenase n=1 Tax=unclassified Pseudomonas TaxID=196821 RepID=UPI0002606EF5|nr:FAD-dependent monooxygenase [Pseudomonas sp. M47T1]EIK97028.1 monooxygenase [Pseudomonas sp. M47T1]
MHRCDVLIVGAGPTGLVLALWLAAQGIQARIIEQEQQPSDTSRALAVQARTLELYQQLGLSEHVLARGHTVAAINLWVKGEPVAHLPFSHIGEGLTPYSFLEIYPQDEHERLLTEQLLARGISVERGVTLRGFVDQGPHLLAQLQHQDGHLESCQAAYLAGCDGARSTVRHVLGSGFPGGTYQQVFYVADVCGQGPAFNGELHVDLDEADFLAVFPLAGSGRARLIGTVRDERAARADTLRFEDISRRAIDHLQVQVDQLNWFSTYHVHHRVTEQFRQGRAFLLGDAAHIHSPAGGQGMNTGIGDAINLAWKLASVLKGQADPQLLDSFEIERIGFARQLVATTDRVFTFATAQGPLADLLRTRLAPLLIPRALALGPVREWLFRTVSQLTLNYRQSALSDGVAGHVHGGDRLPWVAVDGVDNFNTLRAIEWQVHVYGDTEERVRAVCEVEGLGLHVYPWQQAYGHAGFARNALYLVRPDGYVALAAGDHQASTLTDYLARSPRRPQSL